MAKKQRSLSTHIGDDEYLKFALDRLYVLEHVVAGLARHAGAHPPDIDRWRKFIIDWPRNPTETSLSQESQYLVGWAHHLKRPAVFDGK